MKREFSITLFSALLSLFLHPGKAAQSTDTRGAIMGTVSNTTTANLLAGARIETPQLGLPALTDETTPLIKVI